MIRQVVKDYIKGSGIEIGAYSAPQQVNDGVKVTYIDRCPIEKLKAFHSSRADEVCVPVDIIDNGETLGRIPDGSQDFVIANHVFEHFKNPILAIENWTRVLKLNGVIVMSIPDKRYTFDKSRELTPLEHLMQDYWSGITIQPIEADTDEHVWDQNSMFKLMQYIMKRCELDAELIVKREIDTLFILRKVETPLRQELAFWEDIVKNRFEVIAHWFDPTTEVEDRLKPYISADSRIIDIGTGVTTNLGKNLDGKRLNIIGIDILADEYNRLLDINGVVPVVRSWRGGFETVLDTFGRNVFSLVYSTNAIDHCDNPVQAFMNMYAIAKPGGHIFVEVNENEAVRSGGQGLHQWNFFEAGGQLCVARHGTDKSVNLSAMFGDDLTYKRYFTDIYKLEIVIRKGGVL